MTGAADGGGSAPLLLGLGANVGRPAEQIRAAVGALSESLGPCRVSALYRTAPVGYADQPDFFNAVCRIETRLPVDVVFAETSRIERRLGRRRACRNGPRTIDIDLLGYGDAVVDSEAVTIPHPRLHERGFVLVPLADVAPDWRHPRLGLTAAEMLDRLGPVAGVEPAGALFPG